MAALTHYVKYDFTQRTRTASSDTEETNYTINWSDLTGAGFANGDQVALIVICRHGANSVNGYSRFQVKVGSSFAGATVLPGALQNQESALASGENGHAYFFIDDYSLVTNDNIYFSSYSNSSNQNRTDDFFCIVLKASTLGTDYQYAETTPSGDAPTSYTDGASITLPTAGDWLIFGMTQWLADNTSANNSMTICKGASDDWIAVSAESEDTQDTMNLGCLVYRPSAAADETWKVRYRTSSATNAHDCVKTKIMAIRLDAFKDHWGTNSANTITHTVLDTYSECAGKSDYTPTVTGNVLAISMLRHTYALATHQVYGRIQVGGSDWPAAGVGRASLCVNGPATAMQGLPLFGYASLNASTAYDFDFDAAEDYSVATTYSCNNQQAVIFSLELASVQQQITMQTTPHSYSLQGQSEKQTLEWKTGLSPSSFTMSPQAQKQVYGKVLNTVLATYTMGLQSQLQRVARWIGLESTSYSMVGADQAQRYGRVAKVDPTSYTMVSQAQLQQLAWKLGLTPGSYSESPQPQLQRLAWKCDLSPGSYSESPSSLRETIGLKLGLTATSYSLSAQALKETLSIFSKLDPGSYTVAPLGAKVFRDVQLGLLPTSYTLSPSDALLTVFIPGIGDYVLQTIPGSYLITPQDLKETVKRTMLLDPGSYSETGYDLKGVFGKVLSGAPGVFTITGAPINMPLSVFMLVDPGDFSEVGADAALSVVAVIPWTKVTIVGVDVLSGKLVYIIGKYQ